MSEILPMGTPAPWLDNFKQKVKKGFGGGTKQGSLRKKGSRGRGRDGRGVKSFNPYQDQSKSGWLDFYNKENQKKINSGGGFNKEIADRDFEWSNPGQGSLTVMRDYVNPTTGEKTWVTAGKSPKAGTGWQSVDQTPGGFTFDGNWKGKGKAPENAIFSVASNSSQGQRIDDGNTTMGDVRKNFPQLFGSDGKWNGKRMSGFGGTTTQGGTKAKAEAKKVPSDFGEYNPATFGGNLYNQGWGNMVNWGNKFKDNKAIQGFISGARLDANQTMMNMGMDLLYQKGQMSQMADYHGGMENLKTGNTLKLLSAEGGITRDLMWDQGDILSRQIGERGDQDRRTLRATGQENRALVMTQGDQDRRGQRVKGQEQRAGIMTQGKEDRKGLRVKGEEDRLGFRVSGEEDRLGMRVSGEEERLGMRVGGEEERAGIRTRGMEDRLGKREQGAQDRMLTQERGSEERKTQRDRYREDRAMRADARGAIRRSGSRFFG